jgi:hypothetical protein
VGDKHLSRCWLTPTGEVPAIGPDAAPEVALEAAERASVEGA